jgi:methylenetetrahydrofolate dehydrogenase (NADP+) / methenyltetrahydrofolate cyclohydrolase
MFKMKIFDGKKEAEKIFKNLKDRIKNKPVLIIIYIGNNAQSELYIKRKRIAAKKIGATIFCYRFKENAKEKDIIAKIEKNNNYSSVDGIIVQLPLPDKFNADRIINSINSKKDVDGFNNINRNLLKKGNPYFFPVLPSAIFTALKLSSQDFKSKKIIALVNSDIFGKTLKDFFAKEGIRIKYFLRKKIIKSALKKADVIISACGEPGFIKGEMIKDKVILIDAGISFVNNKPRGDVDRQSVERKASFLTPVPGGIGPLTVALLLKNVYKASKL